MSLGPHVRLEDDTHDLLGVLKLIRKKSFPKLLAEALAAQLKSDPTLAAKVDAVRKAAAA